MKRDGRVWPVPKARAARDPPRRIVRSPNGGLT